MAISSEDSPEEWVQSVVTDTRPPASWLRLLTSTDPDDRHRAKYKLGGLTPDDGHFFTPLVDAARSTDERVRFMALIGLKRIGRFPPDLIPLIRDALHDPVQAVLQTAIEITPHFDKPDREMVARVVDLLRSEPNAFVRRYAAMAAGALVAKGANALPHLVDATTDADRLVRTGAVIAIKLLGPLATAAATRMWELASGDPDLNIRNQAGAALRAMGETFG